MIGLLKKDFFILWHAYHKNLALVLVLKLDKRQQI